jgi:crossover junction endodeoxyribonuclease RuvC
MSLPVTDPRTGVFAIDPGVNGAWAVLGHVGEYCGCGELPRFAKLVNAVELGELFVGYRPASAVIEKVGAMPKQGVSSTFTFGTAYGVAIGVAGGSGTPFSLVTPQRWKAHFRLIGKDKDAARELAIRLFPVAAHHLNLKKHVGRADALLLARYALDMDNGRTFA